MNPSRHSAEGRKERLRLRLCRRSRSQNPLAEFRRCCSRPHIPHTHAYKHTPLYYTRRHCSTLDAIIRGNYSQPKGNTDFAQTLFKDATFLATGQPYFHPRATNRSLAMTIARTACAQVCVACMCTHGGPFASVRARTHMRAAPNFELACNSKIYSTTARSPFMRDRKELQRRTRCVPCAYTCARARWRGCEHVRQTRSRRLV